MYVDGCVCCKCLYRVHVLKNDWTNGGWSFRSESKIITKRDKNTQKLSHAIKS